LAIGLPLRNRLELERLLQELYNPASPQNRQFLSPEEFTARFGPTPDDYRRVKEFARTNGLALIGEHSNRMLLDVRGTVENIERTFHTKLRLYKHPTDGRRFYAPEIEPSVELEIPLLDVTGLDNSILPHPLLHKQQVAGNPVTPCSGSGPGGTYRGNDFRAAYVPGVSLTGTGQSVGLLEFDGYYTNDITQYASDCGISTVPLQNVVVSGFSGTIGTNNSEVALDIDMAMCMAPGLSKIIVYEGADGNSILSRMASANQAKQLSSSWGFPINSMTEQIYQQFAAQGQCMIQASGDWGTDILPPSDDPHVVVAGGTTLSTTGPVGAWVSETTWNWYTAGTGLDASGGGVSANYAIPTWQQGVSTAANQASKLLRNVPDVAMAADHIWLRWNNGSTDYVGGTSAAAPLWAGFIALVNQQALRNGKPLVGFANPAIYSLGKSAEYSLAFHDVTTGDNSCPKGSSTYSAVAGYDLCTGWGTPAGQRLINELAGVSNVPPVFKSNPVYKPAADAGLPYAGTIATNATDPVPSNKLVFSKLSGPAWLTVATDGLLSGTPSNSDLGTNTFGVQVLSSSGLSTTSTMSIAVHGAPFFLQNPMLEPTVNVGDPYLVSIAANATDPDGDKLTFAKVSGPAWLGVTTTGFLSGTPSATEAGTNAFVVSVTDPGGLSNTATLRLKVNGAPFFIANPFSEPGAIAAQPYSGTLTTNAADPNLEDSLTFRKLSGPAWLSIGGSGSLFGTPTQSDAGTNQFSVTVTDSGGLTGSASFGILVTYTPPPPVVLKISQQGQQLLLSWSGGTPPFQLQNTTNLAVSAWAKVGNLTSNRSVNMTPSGTATFYRIQGQ
jgi:hypothetical protein